MDKSIAKNFIWNMIGTVLFSFNSLLFMVIVTRINGTETAGIFSFSFSSACIINIIALYCGRTYQVTDSGEFKEESYITTRFTTVAIAMIVTIFFVFVNKYEIGKASIFILLCVLKCIEATSDVYYGVLQKHNQLFVAGKSMTFRSLISFVAFFIAEITFENVYLSCFVLVMVSVIMLLVYDIRHVKKVKVLNYRFNMFNIIKLLKESSYTFFFSFIVMVVINVPRYSIDLLLNDSLQAIYGIISMPATFMMMLGQFIFQPILTKLSLYFNVRDKKAFDLTLIKMSFAIFLILILVLVMAYFLGIPVLQIIYGIDLSNYKFHLLIILMGAAFFAISNIFLNALITIRCTKEQLILQICLFVISIIISIVLTKVWGLHGSIISYAIILALQFVFYIILYMKIGKKRFADSREEE